MIKTELSIVAAQRIRQLLRQYSPEDTSGDKAREIAARLDDAIGQVSDMRRTRTITIKAKP